MSRLFFNDYTPYTENVSHHEYMTRLCPGDDSLVKYYDDIVGDVLSEHFNLKKCPNKHIWYSEWENHRRMVVKLQFFYTHEIWFGYNYDFIPVLNRQDKFEYHRTDKSVDLDVVDMYLYHISYDYENLTHSETFDIRRKYYLPDWGSVNDTEFSKEYIRNVVKSNIPFMLDFYEKYRSDRDVIDFLNRKASVETPRNDSGFDWTKAFLYARLQDMDSAVKAMDKYLNRWSSEDSVKEPSPKIITKLEAARDLFV